ncbi:hypothetical protein TCDM_06398 [Trypanosoma cruzi Dm28c]|uniref:T-cell immunomodulatory protein TIP C2 domain-containing protein n=1 Tax=Trypanosoma cruzi Dm28c TaxID=1416333 RepID=V5DCU8_TRYCR|nr:hypothetical protein TCDM_06398 [Trypanosoma cruzi Dm28c]PBJ72338.1 hypothetical protein BCY84_15929 [Trypanosoma cruzi cruzi]
MPWLSALLSVIAGLLLSNAQAPVVEAKWTSNTAAYLGDAPIFFRVTATADWDNEMKTGLLGTWANRSNLLWYCRGNADEHVPGGKDGALYKLCWSSVDFPGPIVSTIFADFNRDGKLDVLVQCEDGVLYFVNGRHRDDPPTAIPSENVPRFFASTPQMSLVTVFSRCGLPEIALVDVTGSLVIMQATTQTTLGDHCTGQDVVPTFNPFVLVEGVKGVREVVPLSITSDDMDGDCIVDLLYTVHEISSDTLHVYAFFPERSKHVLLLTLRPARRYGFPTVADVNGDGAPDIVFPLCVSQKTSVSFGECTLFDGWIVFYNNLQGSPPCADGGCCNGHPFGFSENASKEFYFHEKNDCGINTSLQIILAMTSSLASPLLLRTGDYNRDGYMDLLVPSTYGPLLLMAEANSNGISFSCGPLDGDRASRSADGDPTYTKAVPFFAIIAGDAALDIVLTFHGASAIPLGFYMNHLLSWKQNYFLGSSALNGAAASHDWGVYQPGAVHRFGWSDFNMRQRWAYATQLSRTQGHALQPSRVLFGLGRTFSYIQGYAVGIVVNQQGAHHAWSVNLVPNSNVFLWLSPLLSQESWRLRLYLVFSTYKRLLILVLVTSLALIAIPIIFLKWREVQHDCREWKLR